MADKFDPLILKELQKSNEAAAAAKEAQKQSDIEAKKFSAEQVAELREIAEVSGFADLNTTKAQREQAQNDIKMLDNQAKLLGISAEELTARQREKEDIEQQKVALQEMKDAITALLVVMQMRILHYKENRQTLQSKKQD